MSKALKRMMKEKEEKRLIELNNDFNINNNKNDNKVKNNLFGNWINNEISISEEEEVEEINNEIKKEPVNNINKNKKNKKKKNKNNKNNKKIKKENKKEEINEFYYQKNDGGVQEKNEKKILFLYTKTFNYNKELDSYFKGSRLVEKENHSNLSKNQLKNLKLYQKINKPKKKYNLIHNEDILFKLPNKLNMEKIKTKKNGVNVFVFKPPAKFEKVEEPYNMVKNSNNPQLMFDFYQENPSFPLIQYDIGEYYRLNNNIKEANVMLEKLIFLYEDSLIYEFKIFDNNSDDKNIVDYSHNEYSKLFFKSILKFIIILMKRSCFKSSLEYCKFLLKLNPFYDPMGSLILIDNLANLSNRYNWLIEFAEKFPMEYSPYYKNYNPKIKYNLILYPNFIFSIAYAKFSIEYNKCKIEKEFEELYKIDKKEIENIKNFNIDYDNSANFFLLLGMILYPKLIKNLINECEIKKVAIKKSYFSDYQKKNINELIEHESIKDNEEYLYSFLNLVNDEDNMGIKKIIEIYPERNKILWKTKEIATWVQSNIGFLIENIDNKNFNKENFINECICPESKESQILVNKFMIPFEPKIHKNLLSKDFSDNEGNINFENIDEDDRLQNNAGNLDMNQNAFSLFINSLLPNSIIPNYDELNPNNNNENN